MKGRKNTTAERSETINIDIRKNIGIDDMVSFCFYLFITVVKKGMRKSNQDVLSKTKSIPNRLCVFEGFSHPSKKSITKSRKSLKCAPKKGYPKSIFHKLGSQENYLSLERSSDKH